MKPTNVIENILGKKKKGKDSDGDRVPDYKDCQPKNTMRQDKASREGMGRIGRNLNNYRGIQ